MSDSVKSWNTLDFGLDNRLIKALLKLGMPSPTMIQSKCIPIALPGKDLMIRSRTGSGKTFAFSLPLLNKILKDKEAGLTHNQNYVKSIILAPTKELCKQIEKAINSLLYYCRDVITCCCLTTDDSQNILQFRLQSNPDIVISTPTKIVTQLRNGTLDLSHVSVISIDEADLILSFGYHQDVTYITSQLPKIVQGFLISATLSTELEKFKKVVLHNPVMVTLDVTTSSNTNLSQFYLETIESDKYLILYVFIKLGLLQGKGVIFVNDINKGYRVKLFLQQFFLSAAVLNAELPINSRLHIIEEFNRGVFDLLIATDTSLQHDIQKTNSSSDSNKEIDDNDNDSDDGKAAHDDDDEEYEEATHLKSNKLKKRENSTLTDKNSYNKNQEFGVNRGIDFQDTSFVINFDFPQSASNYIHRIGRTARGNNIGTAMSFVTIPATKTNSNHNQKGKNNDIKTSENDFKILHEVQHRQPRLKTNECGTNILAAIRDIDNHGGESLSSNELINDPHTDIAQPMPLNFNLKELDSFRYRVDDTLRSVTMAAVKELRAAEIKREILNSEKLKNYFSENPNDLSVLRHDKAVIHPIRQKVHLRAIPSYLVPNSMKAVAQIQTTTKKRKSKSKGQSTESRIMKSKRNDPLNQPMEHDNEEEGEGEETYQHANDDNEDIKEGRADIDYDADADADADDTQKEADNGETNPRVYSSKEVSNLGKTISGRQEWQLRHKKGKFNEKHLKKFAHRTPGTWSKSKVIK